MKRGEQKGIEQAKNPSKRVNIIGAYEVGKSFSYGLIMESMDSEKYLKFMEVLVTQAAKIFQETGKMTFAVHDNCSIHKSEVVKEYWKAWRKQGFYLFFLPPYSPELNRIEVEWRHLKYDGLKGRSYSSGADLIIAILQGIEERYPEETYEVSKVSLN
jgi:putative transposase